MSTVTLRFFFLIEINAILQTEYPSVGKLLKWNYFYFFHMLPVKFLSWFFFYFRVVSSKSLPSGAFVRTIMEQLALVSLSKGFEQLKKGKQLML